MKNDIVLHINLFATTQKKALKNNHQSGIKVTLQRKLKVYCQWTKTRIIVN